MSWLAILLTLASLGGSPAPAEVKPKKQCSAKVTKNCKKATEEVHDQEGQGEGQVQEEGQAEDEAEGATAQRRGARHAGRAAQRRRAAFGSCARGDADADTHAGGDCDSPAPTPAPPGTYPTRTNVDLDEWFVRSSYRALAAGPIEFNVNNRGEDDHNLAVRGGGKEYGQIDLAPGESNSMTLDLWLGNYTLYCSLPDHEEAGMKVDISVR